MSFLNLNYNLINEESVQLLGQNTKVTHLSPGSKARTILDIVNDKMFQQSLQLEENTGRAFLRFAQGQLLDFIGEVFGLERYLSQRAEVSAEENNFYLYTIQPSFGSINGGNDIIIEPGQIIIYDTLNYSDARAIYKNIERIVLPANENKFFFSADALGFGIDYNTGSNTLVYHNFSSYSDGRNGTLLVSNESPILYGRDDESDDNFRFRIKQQTVAAEAANDTAIRTALLGVAGIAEVIKVRYPRGIGTADWIIKAVTAEVSQSLLNSAQGAINLYQAEGTDNKAISPVTIGLSVSFYLVYVSGTDAKDKETAKQIVRNSLVQYVNGLEIGEKLIIDQLVRIILNSSKDIESMGLPNETANFERISIYKRSAFDQSIVKRNLINDYATKYNERVIIESNIDEPIVIKDFN